MGVKAPTEKNFRRARVKPGKRRGSKARMSWRAARIVVTVVLVGYSMYRAFDLVVSAAALKVQYISVHGNVRLSAGEVRTLADGIRGTSILTADLDGYRHRLLESPWVADVALRRVLPSTVEVFVSERSPIGICRMKNQLYLVDRAGTVIDEFGPQYAEFDLPIIDGLVRAPSSGRPALDERRADLAARVLEAIAPRADLARRVSQIDVSDLHDAVVLMKGMRRCCILARTVSWNGCNRIWMWHRRSVSACRTSTTSISGSTIGSTCDRWPRRTRSRESVRSKLRLIVVEGGPWWDVRNDTWSGSMSARRRSPRSSAR